MSRSLSVKLGGSTKETDGRIGAKKSLPAPKKMDADSWIQGGNKKQSLNRENPGNMRFTLYKYQIFTFVTNHVMF